MISPPAPDAEAQAVTIEGEVFTSAAPRLRYAVPSAIAPATTLEIAPGVTWLRMPMPIDLNHINLWLLEDGAGFTLVDTGLAAPRCAEVWTTLLGTPLLQERPLRRILLTHFHPDHLGLAGWLQDRLGIPVTLAKRGREALATFTREPAEWRATNGRHLQGHGLAEAAPLLAGLHGVSRSGYPAAHLDDAQADGEWLTIGGRAWQVLETHGHADGHHCFHSPEAGILISGDQVLPAISSNVSLSAAHWGTDPLGDFIDGLQRLHALPAETLVLPSHGRPFRGLRERASDLIEHHEAEFRTLLAALDAPRCATELMPVMYRRPLSGLHQLLGLQECIAHLEHLTRRGQLHRSQDNQGLFRYQRC